MGHLPLWGASLTAPREGQDVGFHTTTSPFSQVAVRMSCMSVCVCVYVVYECVYIVYECVRVSVYVVYECEGAGEPAWL